MSARKYFPDPKIDGLIREQWSGSAWGRKAGLVVARRTGWPIYAVKRRAVELGVIRQRKREPEWSQAELDLLEQLSHMSPKNLSLQFRARGFHRTPQACELKRKRLRLLANKDWHTQNHLAELLGVDGHKVGRWIKAGWLKATPRGTDRTPQQGGDQRLITRENARKFILAHPTEIDLAKVECAGTRMWFLDLIANGKIGGAA